MRMQAESFGSLRRLYPSFPLGIDIFWVTSGKQRGQAEPMILRRLIWLSCASVQISLMGMSTSRKEQEPGHVSQRDY
jgi:hypothetical protein